MTPAIPFRVRTRPVPPGKQVRVSRIELCDFQAFPGPGKTVISLEDSSKAKGCSLLLYGENGSGKSSLGRALRDMLESGPARNFDTGVHVFSDPPSADRGVTLHFDHADFPAMEWRPGSNAHRQHPLFAAMARSRGWIDYRMLWARVQFFAGNDYANIFEALVTSLLTDCGLPAANTGTFGDLWGSIVKDAAGKPTKASGGTGLGIRVETFSAKLDQFLPELQARANQLLEQFVPWTSVGLTQTVKSRYNTASKGNKFSHGVVSLKVTFRGRPVGRLDGFLNEARITAIALSLYLGALTLSTPPRITTAGGDVFYPRILVLDDILISLDMTHRKPLLKVLNEHFAGWQVCLLTHDRAWYEVAKQRLKGEWRHWELFSVRVGDYERPLSKKDDDHIARAEDFLLQGEPKAAAVHLRTAFELLLKEFCEEFGVEVPYHSNPKEITLRTLWSAVEKACWSFKPSPKPCIDARGITRKWVACEEQSFAVIPAKLSGRLSHALSWVLNPLSHSETIDRYRDELFDAADCLRELNQHWKRMIRDGKDRYLHLLPRREQLLRLLNWRKNQPTPLQL